MMRTLSPHITIKETNIYHLNPKTVWGVSQLAILCGFSKNVFFRERVESWFFVTFNIIINDIFAENFIEVSQLVQKI